MNLYSIYVFIYISYLIIWYHSYDLGDFRTSTLTSQVMQPQWISSRCRSSVSAYLKDWNTSVIGIGSPAHKLKEFRDKHPGGLFIEPAFSTFAVFVIGFIPQITVVLHLPESSISLKSTRVLLTGNVKNLSGSLFFSALSVLDNVCSELGEVFVGTVFPYMWGSAKSRTAALHHICEEVQDDIQWSCIMYVRKWKTTYTSVASYMWGSARRRTIS